MKKLTTTLAAASLTASLGAFAALPTDAQPFQVVVPNLTSGLNVLLEGNYLQPSNSDLDYATLSNFSATSNGNTAITGNVDVKTVDPDYNFGFRVGLGYTFEDSGNDVQLSWTHFNHTDSEDGIKLTYGEPILLTTKLGRVIQSFYEDDIYEFNGTLNTDTTSEAKFKLDAVDLDVGQFIDVGTRLRMRLFAGLRAAQVENNQTTNMDRVIKGGIYEYDLPDRTRENELPLQEINEDITSNYTEQFNSKFTGIGPRFGVDSSYHIGNCFGVVGHASIALLVGQVDTDSNAYLDNKGSLVIPNGWEDAYLRNVSQTIDIQIDSDDVTRVVPAIDAKLGLNYSHIFDNESVLTIEGGYQATHYIDAVDRLTGDLFLPASEKNEPISTVNIERTSSSVTFAGPYLSLNWKV